MTTNALEGELKCSEGLAGLHRTLAFDIAEAKETLQCYQLRIDKANKQLAIHEKKYQMTKNERPVELPEYGLYSEYISGLELPVCFFHILKNTDLALSFFVKANIVPTELQCPCGENFLLGKHFGKTVYECVCGAFTDIFQGLVWRGLPLAPDQILLVLFLWVQNIKQREIYTFTGISLHNVKRICRDLRKIVVHDFLLNFTKFEGVVEIDESCFKSTYKRRAGTKLMKWVFGLYERGSKRCYLQVVEKRRSEDLIPIIVERCTPGATVISDSWAAYGKLTDCGFPHYIVDHTRFFVDPTNREIHTQNIEVTWGWAKYYLKKSPTRAGQLQSRLHEFCWKRRFKQVTKLYEIADTMRHLLQLIKESPDLSKVSE